MRNKIAATCAFLVFVLAALPGLAQTTNKFCAYNAPSCTYSATLSATGNGASGNVAIKAAGSDAAIYVSHNGSDSNDGLSIGTAKATISGAYSALPAIGGKIYTFGGPSCYTIASAVTFGTAGKHVMLIGVGQWQVCLSYTPTTGTALTWDTYESSANNFYSQAASDGMRGIYIVGPGAGTAAVGIAVGGATNGVPSFLMEDSNVQSFGVALTFSEPIANGSWFHHFDNDTFYGDGQAFDNTIDMENVDFVHCLFSGLFATGAEVPNYVVIENGDFHFTDCSFDGAQLVEKTNSSTIVEIVNGHSENPGSTSANTTNPFIVVSAGVLTIHGTNLLNDLTALQSPPVEYINLTGGSAYLSGVTFSGAAAAVTYGVQFAVNSAYLSSSGYFGAGSLYHIISGPVTIVDGTTGKLFLSGSGAFGNILIPNTTAFPTNAQITLPSTTGTLALTSQLPLSGTATGSTTSLAANTCGDAVTSTITGATNSMVAVASPTAAVSAGLNWNAYVSAANTVTVTYCNVTTGAIVPAAATFQIRVIQ